MQETKPLRIALVLNRMDSGGIEATVMNYYRHLDRSKVQFDFYFAKDSSFPQREELEALGAGIYPIPSYFKPLQYQKALISAFKKRKYQIVHVHMSTMSVFPLIAAWIAKVPNRVCHAHSTAHWGEGLRTVLKYILRPFCKCFATDLFACGEMAGRWMYGNRLFDQGKVYVVHNAIENHKFAFDPVAREQIRHSFSIPDESFVVGHIGRFVYQKNHMFLVEIFSEVLKLRPDAYLLLVGEGELEQAVRKKAADMGVLDRVIFTGARRDAAKVYSAMDAFCLPSFYEGMSLVGWEAQSNGLACLLSDQMTTETVLSTDAVQLPLDNAEDWAKRLVSLKRNGGVIAPDITQTVDGLQTFYLGKVAKNEQAAVDDRLQVALVLNRMDSGGIEATVMNYLRYIDRSKVQFDLYYCHDSSFPQRSELEAIQAGIFPIPAYTRVVQYHQTLYNAFRKKHYHVVHAHMSTMSVFPLFAAWRAKVPVRICHSHSTAHWGEGMRTLLKYVLRSFCKLFATDLFACGEHAGRWMYGDRLFDEGQVNIVQNAIDNERFLFNATDRTSLRKEFAIDDDAYVVGHVGRFVYPKNHLFLLEIFAHVLKAIPSAKLMLVGGGELEQSIREKADKLNITDSVIITGVRQDVSRMYSAMDVFCLPSFYEGMGIVAWEAQVNGLPCLLSGNMSHEALLSDLATQLPLGDAEHWAEVLMSMKRSEGAKAPDIRTCALELQNTYLELAQNH
ncbi:MAG: glycosyltransferase family 1 protein [Clostridia bacterium]|nr:glycosyltransferase family 1 protein [Clostridia bacterium]